MAQRANTRSPDFDTILKVLGALGLRLHAEAAHG
jgi:DNA-binding phage protein